MEYRIQLLVPVSYTDEARTMIEEHPRASVIEQSANCPQPGCDLLIVDSSETRILHGLYRWWSDRRTERRANPPLAIIQGNGVVVDFNSRSLDEIVAAGCQRAAPQAG